MATVKIVTDSNSGITQTEAKELGISVIPMPFLINGEDYLEDINLTQEEFYKHLEGEANVSTSQPAVATVTDLWDSLLAEGDDVEIVHIPMRRSSTSPGSSPARCWWWTPGPVASWRTAS